jgi:hypothetical protein
MLDYWLKFTDSVQSGQAKVSGRKHWNKTKPFLTLPRSLKIEYLFFDDFTYLYGSDRSNRLRITKRK